MKKNKIRERPGALLTAVFSSGFDSDFTPLQRIFYIDIPELIPVIVIQLIMSFGNLMNVGFEKAYLLQTSLNKATSEIIATYVYEQGLLKAMYSFSTAVGLFNTVVNIVLLVVVNTVCKRLSDVSFI